MTTNEIKVGDHYRCNMTGVVVRVVESNRILIRFEATDKTGEAFVTPMLTELFAANFSYFS